MMQRERRFHASSGCAESARTQAQRSAERRASRRDPVGAPARGLFTAALGDCGTNARKHNVSQRESESASRARQSTRTSAGRPANGVRDEKITWRARPGEDPGESAGRPPAVGEASEEPPPAAVSGAGRTAPLGVVQPALADTANGGRV
jgi:hypothetical protein